MFKAPLGVALAAAMLFPCASMAQNVGGAANSATINGALLGADVQKSDAARAKNIAAFREALRGFPRDALTLTVTNAAPLPGDPTAINVQYALGVSPQWLAKLRAGLSGLAVAKYRGLDHAEPVGSSIDRAFNQIVVSGKAGNQWGARFCIYDNGTSDCYLLPEGDYGQATLLQPGPLGDVTSNPVVTVRLFAADGTPTSGCLVRVLDKRPNVIDLAGAAAISGKAYGMTGISTSQTEARFFLGTDFSIDTQERNGALLILTSEGNFPKTTRMEFRPFFGAFASNGGQPTLNNAAIGQRNGFAVADITAQVSARDVCALP